MILRLIRYSLNTDILVIVVICFFVLKIRNYSEVYEYCNKLYIKQNIINILYELYFL
jgi:hypothetical protein